MGTPRHGHTVGAVRSKTYNVWYGMRRRCIDPNVRDYGRYGGRGIKVCDRWQKFENFLADMGECPKDRSLDRINNDGNYEPSNCRWATPREQSANSIGAQMITFAGRTQHQSDWMRELGLTPGALWHRLKDGWSLERALTTHKVRS
jgi:hypothetical protein